MHTPTNEELGIVVNNHPIKRLDVRTFECYLKKDEKTGIYSIHDRETDRRILFGFESEDDWDLKDLRIDLLVFFDEAKEPTFEGLDKRNGEWWIDIEGDVRYEDDDVIELDEAPYSIMFVSCGCVVSARYNFDEGYEEEE